MNGRFWIRARLPDGTPVSHAEVRGGCGEADELGSMLANARLIAAAPDLAGALVALLCALEPMKFEASIMALAALSNRIADAEAALAKAGAR